MKLHLSLLLAALLPLSAVAQNSSPAPARPDIEELLVVMRVQKTTEDGLEAAKGMMTGGFMKQMMGNSASPEVKEKAAAMQGRIFSFMSNEISWEKMKGDYVRIYSEVFTPEETKAIIAFYKSPAGQTMLDKQPVLIQKSMEMTQRKMIEILPRLQEMIKKEAEALKAGETAEKATGKATEKASDKAGQKPAAGSSPQ